MSNNKSTFRFGVVGWKNSGKTTLVSNLVHELSKRGLNVATVKHAHHAFDIDHEGTDSFKHRKAGSNQIAIVSRKRWAIIRELETADIEEPTLDEIVAKLEPCDIILIEGYKGEDHMKLEAVGPDNSSGNKDDKPLFHGNHIGDKTIVAVAARGPIPPTELPIFDATSGTIDTQIADFVVDKLNQFNANNV